LHLTHGEAGTQLDGEFTHGEISDPCHRRKEHVIAGLQAANMHRERAQLRASECKAATTESKGVLDVF
jgi:hypothetical protein